MKDIQSATDSADMGGQGPDDADENGEGQVPSEGGDNNSMEYLETIVANMSPAEQKTMLELLHKATSGKGGKMTGELNMDEGVLEPAESTANSGREYQGGR